MRKNVLLLCLSVLSPRASVNSYSYELKNGKMIKLDGAMTDEAPTKAVIEALNAEGAGQKLDKIVAIYSEKVRTEKIRWTPEENGPEKLGGLTQEELGNLTHRTYYEAVIEDFARSKGLEMAEVVPIEISNNPSGEETAQAAIDAANEITKDNEEINLYISFNGGQRYVAFMILAVANLMKIRSVNIRQILTMNFENKIDGVIPIKNEKSIFNSVDLIAGINEYINYGRIKTLKQFFKDAHNREIDGLLKNMENFSNNLQLCRTDTIMEKKGELLNALKKYAEKEVPRENNSYEKLFHYVIADILNGYRGLLDGDLPSIIHWCVEHGFIQQALTFCSEELPKYFWDSGVFAPTAKEKKAYRDHYMCSDSQFKSQVDSSRYIYEWFHIHLNKGHVQDEKSVFTYFPTLRKMGSGSAKQNRYRKNANKRVQHVFETGRAVSIERDRKKLSDILTAYFLLKDQRNMTNHADERVETQTAWSYDDLSFVLKEMAEILEGIKKRTKEK